MNDLNKKSLIGCKVKLKKEFEGASHHKSGIIVDIESNKELYVLGIKVEADSLPDITVLWEDGTRSSPLLEWTVCHYYDIVESAMTAFI